MKRSNEKGHEVEADVYTKKDYPFKNIWFGPCNKEAVWQFAVILDSSGDMFLTVRVSLRKNLTVENRAWLGWLGCLQQPTHHHTQTQNGSHTVFLGSKTSFQQNMQTSNAFCLSAEAGRKCASPLSPRRNRRPSLPGGTAARRDCTERPTQ